MSDGYAYEFGKFRIDPGVREITCDGQLLNIRPRHFDLLLLLVSKQGEVVTREEIIDQVWTGSIIEDGNISLAIHLLRRLIDEPDQKDSRILTIPKRGYTFTTEVRKILSKESQLSSSTISSSDGPFSITRRGSWLKFIPQTWLFRAGLIVLVVLIALLLGSYLIFKSTIRSLTILAQYSIPSYQLDPDFSPDGRFLAFSGLGESADNEDIYLKTVDQAQRIRLTIHPDAERNPLWSPDGKRIAFLRWPRSHQGMARVMVTDSKGEQEVEVGRSRGALGWMPDGRSLVISDIDGHGTASTVLFLASLDGNERRQLTSAISPGTIDTMPRAARFSNRVAFLRLTGERGGDIHLLDIASGQTTQITHEKGEVTFFHWGVREGGFYLVSNRSGVSRLWYFGIPGWVSTIYGQAASARLVEQMPYQLSQFTLLSNPPLLTYSRQIEDNQVRIIDLAGQGRGGNPQWCQLPKARLDQPPQFSPTGDQVAYLSSESGEDGVWLAKSNCSDRIRLANTGTGRISHLRWSPDGSRLVYEQLIDGQSEIWTIGLDGSTPLRLTWNRSDDLDPSWSADGRSIYYVQPDGTKERILRLSTESRETVTILADGGREPVESADGRSLYFVRNRALFLRDLAARVEDPSRQVLKRPFDDLNPGRNLQITPFSATSIAIESDAAIVLDYLDLLTGKMVKSRPIDGIRPSMVKGIGVSADRRYVSINLKLGSLGELSTVEGWRLKPFTEYLLDRFNHEVLFYPERLWRR